VVVRFVDVGGIVDPHCHCLSFLFIIDSLCVDVHGCMLDKNLELGSLGWDDVWKCLL